MVSSPHQCPGVDGKVCNWFLTSEENDSHCLCCACCGKSCNFNDCCEECHCWPDDRCKRVSDYMIKLSLHQKKKCERKASFSSFSGFSSSMLVPLCQLLLPASTGVVTTTPLSTACVVMFSASAPVVSAAPFVPLVDVTQVEAGRKWRCVESPSERAKALVAFKDIWASGRCSSSRLGPSSASQLPLVTPPVPLPAVPAPVPPSCSSSCDFSCSFSRFIGSLGLVFPLGRIFSFPLAITVPSVTWVPPGSREVPASPGPWLAMVPGPVPGPVTCPVGGPIPGPRLLPTLVWLARCPTSLVRVSAICRFCSGRGTGCPRFRGGFRLPGPRLRHRPRVFHGLFLILVRRWSRSWLLILFSLRVPLIAGGPLQILHRLLVPVSVPTLLCLGAVAFPALVGHLRLVRALREWGC